METKVEYIRCDICNEKIALEDDVYYGDTYYDFFGDIVCDDCILEYIKEYKKQG